MRHRNISASTPAARRRRGAVRALALVLLVTVASAATAASGATRTAAAPKPCAKGKVRIVVGGERRCVTATQALAQARGARTVGSLAVRTALGDRLDRFALAAAPPPPRVTRSWPAPPAPLARLLPLIEPLARLASRGTGSRSTQAFALREPSARLAAGGWSAPSSSSTSNGAGTTTTASSTFTSSGGPSATMQLTGTVPNLPNGDPDRSRATLDGSLSFDLGGGASVGVGFGVKLGDAFKNDGPCPSADGKIKASFSNHLSSNKSETGVHVGTDSLRTTTTIDSKGTFDGTVDKDAKLSRIAFDVTVDTEHSITGSFFHGLLRIATTVNVKAHATGTIDGRTGAITVTSLVTDGGGRALGHTSAEATAGVREALRSADTSKLFSELVQMSARGGYDHLKEAEKTWQKPNMCAEMVFTPASVAELAAGATLPVQGKIVSKRDRGESVAVWRAPTLRRGSLQGRWPGASAPSKPLRFTAKGAAPDARTITFDLGAHATSRAGVAEADWQGKNAGWRVTIDGPVSQQQGVCCYILSSTIHAVVDVVYLTRDGISAFYGTSPLVYTTPTVAGTPLACSVPGASDYGIAVYAFGSVVGHADVQIVPDGAASAPKIKVILSLGDRVTAQLTCPGFSSLLEGLLATPVFGFPPTTAPPLVVSATDPSSSPFVWSSTYPFSASGNLVVKVAPL